MRRGKGADYRCWDIGERGHDGLPASGHDGLYLFVALGSPELKDTICNIFDMKVL